MDAVLPYNNTEGYVSRQASRERAVEEAVSGIAADRQRMVLTYLLRCGERGATWKEASTALNLHHGQISGCLSALHSGKKVFMLRQKRGRCHPYVHTDYRDIYHDGLRFDEPAKTRSGDINQRIARANEIVTTAKALSAMYAEKCGSSEDKVVFCLLEEMLTDCEELLKVGNVGQKRLA